MSAVTQDYAMTKRAALERVLEEWAEADRRAREARMQADMLAEPLERAARGAGADYARLQRVDPDGRLRFFTGGERTFSLDQLANPIRSVTCGPIRGLALRVAPASPRDSAGCRSWLAAMQDTLGCVLRTGVPG